MKNTNQGKPHRGKWLSEIDPFEWLILFIAVVSILGFLYMAEKTKDIIPPNKTEKCEISGGTTTYDFRSSIIKRCNLPEDFTWSYANKIKYASQIERTIKEMR